LDIKLDTTADNLVAAANPTINAVKENKDCMNPLLMPL
jgi:hypothetical protein